MYLQHPVTEYEGEKKGDAKTVIYNSNRMYKTITITLISCGSLHKNTL